jgi:histidinol-phosphate aminotransferase
VKSRLRIREAILKRKTYEAPAEGRAGKVRLDFNENTTGCGPAVLKALKNLTARQIAMYPEYAQSTRRIARYFGVGETELLLTNGGDDALRVFFDVFVEPRSRILICEPTFPMYRYWAEIAGAKIDVLRYDNEMKFPLAGFLAALRKKPRVAFIANPNNPTGTLLGPGSIRRILSAAWGTAVVMDEAYSEFSGETSMPLIHKYTNLFVARTFSKAAGLASLRLGAVIAKRENVALLKRAMPPFPVNAAALAAAEAAIKEGSAIRRYVAQTKRVRDWFTGELENLGVRVFPSAGNFVLVDFGSSGPSLFQRFAAQAILVRERSKDIGPGFARITIGTEQEMKQLLAIVKAAVAKSSRRGAR